MNLSAIKRNCMATRRAVIYNALHGGQWILDGVAAWKVDGLRVDSQAIISLFNLSNKQLDNMTIMERVNSDPRFTPSVFEGEEDSWEIGAMVYLDSIVCALHSGHGTLWIPYDAVRHIKNDARRYAIRWRFGRPLVAVYGDLLCSALVLPMGNADAEAMTRTATRMAATMYHWPDEQQEAADAEAAAESLLERTAEGIGEGGGEA